MKNHNPEPPIRTSHENVKQIELFVIFGTLMSPSRATLRRPGFVDNFSGVDTFRGRLYIIETT
jgi:hypothetical protein